MTTEKAILKDLSRYLRSTFPYKWSKYSSKMVAICFHFNTRHFGNLMKADLFFRFHIEGTMIKSSDSDVVSLSDPNYKEKVKAFIDQTVERRAK